MFLNSFLRFQKKIKVDDFQALDIFNKKLGNEFKNCLVNVKKVENLNNFITFLWDIDANVKQISKHSHFCTKPVNLVSSTTKPLFKTGNFISAKPFISVRVTATAPGSITVTNTHPDPINISIASQRGPILQAKKTVAIALAYTITIPNTLYSYQS